MFNLLVSNWSINHHIYIFSEKIPNEHFLLRITIYFKNSVFFSLCYWVWISVICFNAHREDVIAAWGCVIGGVELPTPGSHVWLTPWNVLYIWVYVNQGQEIRKRLNSGFLPHDSSKTITPIEADKFVQVNMTPGGSPWLGQHHTCLWPTGDGAKQASAQSTQAPENPSLERSCSLETMCCAGHTRPDVF